MKCKEPRSFPRILKFHFLKNHKRASLQMSVNTIVLLVLALALLGIVLGATIGLFDAGREKLMESMLRVDASAKATSRDVIAGGDAFTLKRNKDQILAVSFYNKGNVDCAQAAHIVFRCPGVLTQADYANVDIAVPLGQERTLPAVLKINSLIPKNDYVCSLKVRCGETQTLVAEEHTILRVK